MPISETREVVAPSAACAADRSGDTALVGKTEAEAAALLSGCRWRVGERDGVKFMMTMDFFADRRTLGITAGNVIWVRRG